MAIDVSTSRVVLNIHSAVTVMRTIVDSPALLQGHANLASAFKDAARQDAAIASYRRALALRPDFPEAFANLVHSLQVGCCPAFPVPPFLSCLSWCTACRWAVTASSRHIVATLLANVHTRQELQHRLLPLRWWRTVLN